MPWPSDHPARTDAALAPWGNAIELLCPDAEIIRVLRHLPGRRVTSLVRTGNRDAVLKLFASPRARGNERRLRRLKASDVAELVPAPLGADSTGHLGLVEFVPGTALDQLDGESFVAALRSAGVALRRLHGSGVELDRSWTIDEELDQLTRRATDRASAAIAFLVGLDLPRDVPLVSAHRDCHPAQAVIGAEGLHWIDLDDVAMAPAGLDLGNLAAHVRRDAAIGKRPQGLVDHAVAALFDGYGDVPEHTEQWEWLTLGRLACLAEVRHRRPDWADEILSLLALRTDGATVGPAVQRRPVRQQDAVEPGVDLTEVLNDLGLVATGDSELIVTGHADRPVFRVDTNAGPVAVKGMKASHGLSAFRDLSALWESPFGASRSPCGLARPIGWSAMGSSVVMEWLPGAPLAVRGDPPPPADRLPDIAQLAADLHSSGVRHRRVRDVEAVMRSIDRKARELQGTDVGDVAMSLVEELARRLPDDGEMVATHGDFSPRNVMVTEAGLRLIDFDRLQLADPARDVCYYGAWLWVTGFLHDGTADWSLGDRLLEEYRERRPECRVDDQVPFHRIAALLRIAHGWTVLRREPGLARPVLEEAGRLLAH